MSVSDLEIVVSAPAKLNLVLKVWGRLPNGYHELQSLIVPISLSDKVTIAIGGKNLGGSSEDFELSQEAEIHRGSEIHCAEKPSIRCRTTFSPALSEHLTACSLLDPRQKDVVKSLDSPGNLAYQAAELFYLNFGDQLRDVEISVEISIEKQIPFGAGLGGGSSDAAAVLWGLNNLHGDRFSRAELMQLGGRLGSDIPAMLAGGPSYVWAVGDRVTPVAPKPKSVLGKFERSAEPLLRELTGLPIFLVKPPWAMPTAVAYRQLKRGELQRGELRREPSSSSGLEPEAPLGAALLESFGAVPVGLPGLECLYPLSKPSVETLSLAPAPVSQSLSQTGLELSDLSNRGPLRSRLLSVSANDFGEALSCPTLGTHNAVADNQVMTVKSQRTEEVDLFLRSAEFCSELRSLGLDGLLLAGSGSTFAVLAASVEGREDQVQQKLMSLRQSRGWFVAEAYLNLVG